MAGCRRLAPDRLPDYSDAGQKHEEKGMDRSALYHDGHRRLQDEFGSRPMADHLEAKRVSRSFKDADKQFIENAVYFFMATADASRHT